MTISIVYSIMTTIRVGGAKSCPEGNSLKLLRFYMIICAFPPNIINLYIFSFIFPYGNANFV